MGQQMDEATASQPTRTDALDRRAMVRRLAAASAVAWAAPEMLATRRASAMAISGCSVTYDFDDGTLQGWVANNLRAAGWQVSAVHSLSGANSLWFGHAGAFNSLYPVRGEPSYRQGNHAQWGTVTSPPTTAASTDIVCFDIRLAIEATPAYDLLRLYIVQGAVRVPLWNKSQSGFAILDHPENRRGSQVEMLTTEGNWSHIEVTIGTPPAINLDNPVQFEFDFQTVDGNYNRTEGIYIDNINLPCGGGTGVSGGATRRSGELTLSAPVDSGFLPGYRPPPAATAPDRGAA